MSLYKKITASFLIASAVSLSAFAGSNFSYTKNEPVYTPQQTVQPVNYDGNTPLRGSVVMVPAGETFSALLPSDISSATAIAGQSVVLVLNKNYYYKEKLIAPAGSNIVGSVIEVQRAKHGSINGKMTVRFTQINTPMGTQIPISAVIRTDDNSGTLVGGTKVDVAKDYTKDLAIGSAAGALSGLVFGALAGGSHLGRGVALGTAVGAGGGLVKSTIDKGNDVTIPANSDIDIVLTQPITTSASNYSYEN